MSEIFHRCLDASTAVDTSTPRNVLIKRVVQQQDRDLIVDYSKSIRSTLSNRYDTATTSTKYDDHSHFCSIDTDSSMKASRRGDVESLCYSMIFSCTKSLPWHNLRNKVRIYEKKVEYKKRPKQWTTWMRNFHVSKLPLIEWLVDVLKLVYAMRYNDSVDFPTPSTANEI